VIVKTDLFTASKIVRKGEVHYGLLFKWSKPYFGKRVYVVEVRRPAEPTEIDLERLARKLIRLAGYLEKVHGVKLLGFRIDIKDKVARIRLFLNKKIERKYLSFLIPPLMALMPLIGIMLGQEILKVGEAVGILHPSLVVDVERPSLEDFAMAGLMLVGGYILLDQLIRLTAVERERPVPKPIVEKVVRVPVEAMPKVAEVVARELRKALPYEKATKLAGEIAGAIAKVV